MQKFTYDMFSRIEIPTFVLSNVYHHQIGVLNCIDIDSINVNFNMNSQQEISFDIYKELNGEKCELWDDIVSLRYIYVPEHHEYYKIEVSTDDESKTVKHLVCSSASEYELSNKIIRSLEINTDTDILRNNTNDQTIPPYAPNILYNPSDPSNSILHRTLADKAPDWSIKHVDSTIANIQRTFSVSNQKIYDFLTQTLAKEYDCLFVFDSVDRTISAYDLLNICDDCGKRGEFTNECTKCHGHNISKGYGNDTHIFINYNNFSEKITLEGDEGAVKNCFSVQGGDDIMSATVRNINPNGSEYIYNFSEADYKDMPQSLIDKLEDYQEEYNRVLPEYQSITEKWYDSINNYYYYKTSMMPRVNGTAWKANVHYDINDRVYVKTLPTWCYLECVKAGVSGSTEFDATSVTEGQIIEDGEVKWKVCKNILSIPDAKGQLDNVIDYFRYEVVYFYNEIPESITSVSNEVKNVAGFAVDSLYKVEIVQETNYPKKDNVNWFGKIKVYNSANPEDSCTSTDPIMVYIRVVNDILDYTNYISQQVDKRLHKADITYESVLDIEIPRTADMEYDKDADTLFKNALTEYSLDSLSNFEKSYKACLDTLSSNGIKDKTSKYMGWDTYSIMYEPYYTRLTWIQDEMNKREETVDYYDAEREKYADQMREYNNALNLQTFLGDDLFKIFWSYIREDTYQNSNYISTGLSDGAVINDAKQLLEVAQDELKKACELQVTLNDDISNLLNTEEFKDFKSKFNIGDFIMCEVDDQLYRLRLISSSFAYSNPENINLTFSNFTKIENFLSDAQSVINSAQSISGSYNAVMHQVLKNTATTTEVDEWKENGIASSNANIVSNADQEVIIDQNGILARQYDDTTETYSDKQFKITHNFLSFTDDNWETTAMGIGENEYIWYNNEATEEHPIVGWNTDIGYGVNAKFITAGYVNGTQIIGGEIYSDNYEVADPSHGVEASGSYINLRDGGFTLAGDGLIGYWDETTQKYNLSYNGDVTGYIDAAVGSHLGAWTVRADGLYGTSAYLKPNGVSINGIVGATDYLVGSGDNSFYLTDALDSKQDVLTAGQNITIETVGDETVISSTGGSTIIANPEGSPQDVLQKIEIDDVIYQISGGGGGLQYFVETQTSLYGQNTIDDELRRNWNYRFNHAVSARYNLHEPFSTWGDVQFDTINDNGEVVIAVTWERTIITSLWSQSTGEDNGIMVITTDPTVCGLNATDRTSIYQTLTASYVYGDFTDEQSHYDAIGGWATSTFTYQGTTYYVMLCHNNTYKDWSYEADSIKTIGSTLHYKDDRGIYSSVAEFALAVFTMSNTGQTISSYSGLHQGDNLAFFAGGSDSTGTDAPIKIFSDGTTEGLVTEEEIQDYAKKEDVPEIEANPQDTPTDVLNSINIDGTAYEIQGGGGGSNLIVDAQIYSENEQVVGVWTDGKPLYQKSWILTIPNQSGFLSFTSGMITDLENVVWNTWSIRGLGQQTETPWYTSASIYFDAHTASEISFYANGTYLANKTILYTAQYTKTTDSAGSGGYQAYGFSPIIYSTEEREVGVWTDNKPLYQKTYANVNLSNNQDVVIDANVSTMQLKSYVIDFSGTTNTSTQQTGANDTLYIDSRGLIYWINRPSGWWSALNNANITVWYTKTTDVAGSGSYNTLGIPNVHYDGNEKIIGTWFGATLYEKTINTTIAPPYSSIDLSSLNINEVVGFEGCSKSSGGDSIPIGYSVASGNQYLVASFEKATSILYISLGSGLSTYNNVFLTIRYTKTS